MKNSTISYMRHRFPQQIISHAFWLYFMFLLSLSLVEEMLPDRGIIVSYETIRRGVGKSDRPTRSYSVARRLRAGTLASGRGGGIDRWPKALVLRCVR